MKSIKKLRLTQFVIGGPAPGGFAMEHMEQLLDESNTEIP